MDKEKITEILVKNKVPENYFNRIIGDQGRYEAQFGPMEPQTLENMVAMAVKNGYCKIST